ncbi:MAG: methyltransferase domain-containing protein [Bdellovibrionales bacterium]|jgi:hypothetical protein|nr:methyltransferase domain-containing protein [Bdellovibrionales bacterium]MBT3525239.1 methyltransferase domain-containing protein [Bdellovibrionales bacterium]
MREIKHCEVCGNVNLYSSLDLGEHPMCDDLVPVGDERICQQYPIEILFCSTCITGHQRYQVPKDELFPATYHYRSRFTADVLKGMQNFVDGCEQRFGDLHGKSVVDIGCNDGSLLGFFREKGAVTIGIEPTDAADDAKLDGHEIFKEYFSEEVAQKVRDACGAPDYITFTNVFAHIEGLVDVLCALKKMMKEDTVVVIENHYLGSVLDGNQFDTFYHEHPRTYSYTSFIYMARTLGVQILDVDFPSRYGGNIRVYLGLSTKGEALDQNKLDALDKREATFESMLAQMKNNIECWKNNKSAKLKEMVMQFGPLRAKAFPGRAAILVKLLGIDQSCISEVYEKPGSLKIGHYLPGTRIPICSDDELFAKEDKMLPLLNLAWHIPHEIKSYLSEGGYVGPVIDVLSPDDFLP